MICFQAQLTINIIDNLLKPMISCNMANKRYIIHSVRLFKTAMLKGNNITFIGVSIGDPS